MGINRLTRSTWLAVPMMAATIGLSAPAAANAAPAGTSAVSGATTSVAAAGTTATTTTAATAGATATAPAAVPTAPTTPTAPITGGSRLASDPARVALVRTEVPLGSTPSDPRGLGRDRWKKL